MVYIHSGMLSAVQRERNFVIRSNMDGLGGHDANEISQTEKDKRFVY